MIRPATPAAASRWPMLALTDPIAQYPRLRRPERLGQRLDLDRIAERRRRAVRLRGRRSFRGRLRRWPGHPQSPGSARSTPGAVKLARRAPSLLMADPRMTAYIVSPSASASSSRFSTTMPAPFAEDGAVRLRVERAAVPVGREDALFLIEIPGLLRQPERDAAGQRHVAFRVQQALTGEVDRHERGRAGRLHGTARPLADRACTRPASSETAVRCRSPSERPSALSWSKFAYSRLLIRAGRRPAVDADQAAIRARDRSRRPRALPRRTAGRAAAADPSATRRGCCSRRTPASN